VHWKLFLFPHQFSSRLGKCPFADLGIKRNVCIQLLILMIAILAITVINIIGLTRMSNAHEFSNFCLDFRGKGTRAPQTPEHFVANSLIFYLCTFMCLTGYLEGGMVAPLQRCETSVIIF
jgi:hypothetical protein